MKGGSEIRDPKKQIGERIRELDPADLEDLCEKHPGVAPWLKDLDAGEDVVDMLEDYRARGE